MSTAQMSNQQPTPMARAGKVDLKLEVTAIPVADVDRAKRFYTETLGWRLDADFTDGKGWRGVQVTPPGSASSIQFGAGGPPATPGAAQGMILVVDNIDVARADLINRGVAVSEVFHYDGFSGPRLKGPDPNRGSYRSWASFNDPDGNGWLLQEIKERFPGRGLSNDVTTLTSLLREAEEHHGAYESTAPKHHWSNWYAAYILAREQGRTPEEAASDAALHMKGIIQ